MSKKADITLDIDKGDTLLGGKFKNSPLTVEEFGTDENGQPTVNDKKLLSMRIKKQMPGGGSSSTERVPNGGNASPEVPAGSAASVFKQANWWEDTREIGGKAIDFFAQPPRSQGILPTEAGIYAPDEADKLKERYTETAPAEGSFFKPDTKKRLDGLAIEMFGKYASAACNGDSCSIESSGAFPDMLPSDADFQVPFDDNGEPIAVPVNGVYKGGNMNIRRNTMDERTKNAVRKAGELMGIVKMLTGKEANMADVFTKQKYNNPNMSFNPEEGDEVARIADKAYKDNHEVTYDWDKPVNPPKKQEPGIFGGMFGGTMTRKTHSAAIDVISKRAGMGETILNILKSQAVPLGIGGGVLASLYGINKLQDNKDDKRWDILEGYGCNPVLDSVHALKQLAAERGIDTSILYDRLVQPYESQIESDDSGAIAKQIDTGIKEFMRGLQPQMGKQSAISVIMKH